VFPQAREQCIETVSGTGLGEAEETRHAEHVVVVGASHNPFRNLSHAPRCCAPFSSVSMRSLQKSPKPPIRTVDGKWRVERYAE
jgi:hypothetical protein